ncbi:hypothetical protein B0T24DRAFT_653594 [Lasiosphaeria ovina]|uniref:Uncharacterized protein n=1 Tax=Lasiosphaeria ovina TaxID=92902 RepID=A0AAE0TWY1_9PEZI|nr:hypothetical protein B0T24DRAFT_653594 [Lasiosphaeria ovina]
MAGASSTASKKTVLITGGIGWALAKAFRARGFHVFATLRDVAKAGGLGDDGDDDMDALALDVTSGESTARCRDAVAAKTAGSLDVLAFAPLLIKARGTVADNSSIAQGLPMAWTGDYASSKAAAARMSEVMRVELAPLGVRVVTVMVRPVATPMFMRPGGRMQLPEASHYRSVEEFAHRMRLLHLDASMPVAPFANQLAGRILAVADSSSTIRGLIWLGTYALLVRCATWAMPQWRVDQTANNDKGVDLVKRLCSCLLVMV